MTHDCDPSVKSFRSAAVAAFSSQSCLALTRQDRSTYAIGLELKLQLDPTELNIGQDVL